MSSKVDNSGAVCDAPHRRAPEGNGSFDSRIATGQVSAMPCPNLLLSEAAAVPQTPTHDISIWHGEPSNASGFGGPADLRPSSQDRGTAAKTLGSDLGRMSPYGTTNSTGPGFPDGEGCHRSKMLRDSNLHAESMASLPSLSDDAASWSLRRGRIQRKNSWLESFQGMAAGMHSPKEWLSKKKSFRRTSRSSLDLEDRVWDAHAGGTSVLKERCREIHHWHRFRLTFLGHESTTTTTGDDQQEKIPASHIASIRRPSMILDWIILWVCSRRSEEDSISASDEPVEGEKVTESAGTHLVEDMARLRQAGVMRMSILISAIAVPFSAVFFSLGQNVYAIVSFIIAPVCLLCLLLQRYCNSKGYGTAAGNMYVYNMVFCSAVFIGPTIVYFLTGATTSCNFSSDAYVVNILCPVCFVYLSCPRWHGKISIFPWCAGLIAILVARAVILLLLVFVPGDLHYFFPSDNEQEGVVRNILVMHHYLMPFLAVMWTFSTTIKGLEARCRTNEEQLLEIMNTQSELVRMIDGFVPFQSSGLITAHPSTWWLRSPVESWEDTSILQTDITSFTHLSSQIKPEELIDIINCLFSATDFAATCVGAWKAEMIGDCWVGLAGGPIPCENKALRTMLLSWAIMDIVEDIARRLELPLSLRIGLHTGRITGAIVGSLMPRFLIFGKDAEIAKLLEQKCKRGCVHVSEATRDQLPDWQFEASQPIILSDGDEVQCFSVPDPRPRGSRNYAVWQQALNAFPKLKSLLELLKTGMVNDNSVKGFQSKFSKMKASDSFNARTAGENLNGGNGHLLHRPGILRKDSHSLLNMETSMESGNPSSPKCSLPSVPYEFKLTSKVNTHVKSIVVEPVNVERSVVDKNIELQMQVDESCWPSRLSSSCTTTSTLPISQTQNLWPLQSNHETGNGELAPVSIMATNSCSAPINGISVAHSARSRRHRSSVPNVTSFPFARSNECQPSTLSRSRSVSPIFRSLGNNLVQKMTGAQSLGKNDDKADKVSATFPRVDLNISSDGDDHVVMSDNHSPASSVKKIGCLSPMKEEIGDSISTGHALEEQEGSYGHGPLCSRLSGVQNSAAYSVCRGDKSPGPRGPLIRHPSYAIDQRQSDNASLRFSCRDSSPDVHVGPVELAEGHDALVPGVEQRDRSLSPNHFSRAFLSAGRACPRSSLNTLYSGRASSPSITRVQNYDSDVDVSGHVRASHGPTTERSSSRLRNSSPKERPMAMIGAVVEMMRTESESNDASKRDSWRAVSPERGHRSPSLLGGRTSPEQGLMDYMSITPKAMRKMVSAHISKFQVDDEELQNSRRLKLESTGPQNPFDGGDIPFWDPLYSLAIMSVSKYMQQETKDMFPKFVCFSVFLCGIVCFVRCGLLFVEQQTSHHSLEFALIIQISSGLYGALCFLSCVWIYFAKGQRFALNIGIGLLVCSLVIFEIELDYSFSCAAILWSFLGLVLLVAGYCTTYKYIMHVSISVYISLLVGVTVWSAFHMKGWCEPENMDRLKHTISFRIMYVVHHIVPTSLLVMPISFVIRRLAEEEYVVKELLECEKMLVTADENILAALLPPSISSYLTESTSTPSVANVSASDDVDMTHVDKTHVDKTHVDKTHVDKTLSNNSMAKDIEPVLHVIKRKSSVAGLGDLGLLSHKYRETSVMFAYLVGFSEFSIHYPPEVVVKWVQSVFSAFDEVMKKHGDLRKPSNSQQVGSIVKVESFQNFYFVVAGCPEYVANHAEQCVTLAIKFIASAKGILDPSGEQTVLKLGVNSGPLSAGIICEISPRFTCLGDTVNTASRMASTSQACVPRDACIQISDSTKALLSNDYIQSLWMADDFTTGGMVMSCTTGDKPVEIKGKGMMKTSFVRSFDSVSMKSQASL